MEPANIPLSTSHEALIAYSRDDAAFISQATGSATLRLLVLAHADRRLRDDPGLTARVSAASAMERQNVLRALVLDGIPASRDAAALARAEQLHYECYHKAIAYFGSRRSDKDRDNAAMPYLSAYHSAVSALAWALIGGTLTFAQLRLEVRAGYWPRAAGHNPWRAGLNDLIDATRSPRSRERSMQGDHQPTGSTSPAACAETEIGLSTTRDPEALIIAREGARHELREVAREYTCLTNLIAAKSDRLRTVLELALAGRASADIGAELARRGLESMRENTIDVAWGRALQPFPLIKLVLARGGPDFDENVRELALAAALLDAGTLSERPQARRAKHGRRGARPRVRSLEMAQ